MKQLFYVAVTVDEGDADVAQSFLDKLISSLPHGIEMEIEDGPNELDEEEE